jgi:hypothetical protein
MKEKEKKKRKGGKEEREKKEIRNHTKLSVGRSVCRPASG